MMALVEVPARVARLYDRKVVVERIHKDTDQGRVVLPRWFARVGDTVLIYAAEIDGEPVLVLKKLTEGRK